MVRLEKCSGTTVRSAWRVTAPKRNVIVNKYNIFFHLLGRGHRLKGGPSPVTLLTEILNYPKLRWILISIYWDNLLKVSLHKGRGSAETWRIRRLMLQKGVLGFSNVVYLSVLTNTLDNSCPQVKGWGNTPVFWIRLDWKHVIWLHVYIYVWSDFVSRI